MSKMKRRTPSNFPPRDSLAWKLCDYLHTNLGEELTRHDIAIKFDVDTAAVDGLLEPAERAGLVERRLSNEDGVVWRLPRSKAAFPRPFAPSLLAARRALKKRTHVVIDFSTLRIEPEIPMPEPNFGSRRTSQWVQFLSRFDIGDSAQFERQARDAVAHAQSAYRRKRPEVRFAIRTTSDLHVRIWRTA